MALKAKQTPYASTGTIKCKTVTISGRPLLSYEALDGVFEHLGQSNEHLQWRVEDFNSGRQKIPRGLYE